MNKIINDLPWTIWKTRNKWHSVSPCWSTYIIYFVNLKFLRLGSEIVVKLSIFDELVAKPLVGVKVLVITTSKGMPKETQNWTFNQSYGSCYLLIVFSWTHCEMSFPRNSKTHRTHHFIRMFKICLFMWTKDHDMLLHASQSWEGKEHRATIYLEASRQTIYGGNTIGNPPQISHSTSHESLVTLQLTCIYNDTRLYLDTC